MFRLRLLGGFALEGPGGVPVSALPHRRAMATLAVLGVTGDFGCSRERLLALLWPESDEAHAGHGLRDAIHAIRRALGPGAVPSGGPLLRLDSAVVVSDVRAFAQALGSGAHADAVRAYAGPLLDGFHVDDAAEFERWLDGERTRLAREYVEALKRLAAAAERAGARDEAAGWWARAVEHDPLNSHLVLQHVRVLAAIGDRANAIRLADVHARRLREELDLDPDQEFLATIERIRRGELPAPLNDVPRLTPVPLAEPPQAVEEMLRHVQPAATPSDGTTAAWTPRARTVERVRRWLPWAAGVVLVVVLAGVSGVGRWMRARPAEAHPPRTAIAALPFQNLSADSSLAYFAGGLHDELLTQLAKVGSLRVVGRTSVSGYRNTSKPLRQIGQELAVGSVVEGSVQVHGNQLRVIVQLIDPVTEAHLWAERYDRTLDDAFAVQSDIAQRIVAAVGATLTSAEAGALAAAPTRNPEAYQLYLQGLEYRRRPGVLRHNLEIAQQLFERALALDAAFAQAHAALSVVSWAMYGLGYDASPARLEQAQREAETALRLAPDLPEGHYAGGLRYLLRGDVREASDEFKLGLRRAPNDADLWKWFGVAQRNLGNWDSAFVAFAHTRRLDPRDTDLLQILGDTYHFLHRYRDAIEAYRLELVFAPDLVQPRLSLAWSYVLWKGELDTLRTVLRALPPDADPGHGGVPIRLNRLGLAQLERRPDSILALVRAGASAPSELTYWTEPAHRLRGDTAAARAVLDSAAVLLSAQERARPDDYGVHAARGLVLAKLGRRADALREVRWLAQSDERSENHYHRDEGARALILATSGDTDAALAAIERVLSGPSLTTVHMLRLDPNWDVIRGDPRFQALLLKYATPGTR